MTSHATPLFMGDVTVALLGCDGIVLSPGEALLPPIGPVHCPALQILSPLHCVSYWHPCWACECGAMLIKSINVTMKDAFIFIAPNKCI